MRINTFLEARPLGCLSACPPDYLARDGHIRAPVVHRAGEQIRLRLHPAPVLPQGFQKRFTQIDIAVAFSFALTDVDDHPLLIDIAHFQVAQLGFPHTGRVERHQNGTMHQVAGRVDELGHLLLAQHDR